MNMQQRKEAAVESAMAQILSPNKPGFRIQATVEKHEQLKAERLEGMANSANPSDVQLATEAQSRDKFYSTGSRRD